MARVGYGKHATQVNASSYPDDGSSPVGTNEWNEAPSQAGILGFSPTNATVTISSGALTPTDSLTVVASESGTSDTITSIALTNTNQYDLLYLFADTGDTITLTNTSSPSSNGQVKTVSNANETLSETSPTILIRKGNYWYGYGGGVVNAVSDIGDVTISSIGSGELLKWNGSAWVNNTLAEAGFATSATTDTTNASNIGSGTLAAGRVATLNQDTTGNAGTVTSAANDSANETVYPTFVDAQTGAQEIETDVGLTYNPSTGALTSTSFVGNVTGNVTGNTSGSSGSCTGNSATATLASTVTVTDNESTNEDNALIFTAGGDVDGGNLGLESDGTCTYNPSTGKITATGFVGDVTGNASGTAATVTGGTQSSITNTANLVETGALNAGSITSGFGTIDTGSSAISTTGTVTTGAIAAGGALDMNSNSITEIKKLDTTIGTGANAVDFNNNEETTLTISTTATFTGTNYGSGKHQTIHIANSGASARTLNFPAGWIFYGEEPSSLTASKKACLSLTCLGSNEADVRAVYVEEA